jgi:hypothetical protein
MRYSVAVTRQNEHSVSEDLGEMMAWLKKAGIQPQALRAKQIINGRVVYEAAFDSVAEAERFVGEFDQAELGMGFY